MKGFKAFGKGMVCKGKQYAENTVFEEEDAEICKKGMHFCEKPFDVLDYYPIIDDNCDFAEFAEVESLEEAKTDDNKKYCTKKLKIGAKINFAQLVKADIDFILEKTEQSSGNSAQIGSSGKHSVVCCAGNNSIAKAKTGSWITLSEWSFDNNENTWIPVCVKTEFVDGKKNQRGYILPT